MGTTTRDLDNEAWRETLTVLRTAESFKELRDGIWDVHEKSIALRDRGHRGVALFAAQYLNFFENKDPAIIDGGGFKMELRASLERLAARAPDGAKAAEYVELLK